MRFVLVAFALFLWHATTLLTVQRYTARQSGDIITLEDSQSKTSVSIIPAIGNLAFSMNVKGQDILFFPFASLDEFKVKPRQAGIPLLAPWANRLDETAFYANGKRYAFDMELGNVRGPIPIHGLVQNSNRWKVIDIKSDATSARLTSRLEVYRDPAWMQQWPFAHTIEMTHALRDGQLEVQTRIANLSTEPMPIAIGFHPYFQLTDSSRDEWTIAVAARTRWLLAPNKLPTGEIEPIEKFFPNPQAVRLDDYNLDDVFGDLVRDANGRATMALIGKSQRLEVSVGPNYRAMVIWAPKTAANPNFICFEPMAGVTNALNLAHKGIYKELQHVQPGATWSESIWVRPSGF